MLLMSILRYPTAVSTGAVNKYAKNRNVSYGSFLGAYSEKLKKFVAEELAGETRRKDAESRRLISRSSLQSSASSYLLTCSEFFNTPPRGFLTGKFLERTYADGPQATFGQLAARQQILNRCNFRAVLWAHRNYLAPLVALYTTYYPGEIAKKRAEPRRIAQQLAAGSSIRPFRAV